MPELHAIGENPLMNSDIETSAIYRKIVRSWWVLILFFVAGGLAGWGISTLRQPLYEAKAVLGIGIDYGRTFPLDENTYRDAYDRVRALLYADSTLEGIYTTIESGYGDSISSQNLDALRSRLRLGDKGTTWELLALSTQPGEAAALATAWAESAMLEFERAQEHAWRASELQAKFFNLGCSLEPAPDHPEIVAWECDSTSGPPDPEGMIESLVNEVSESKGILPAFSYTFLQDAVTPSSPVIQGRGSLILSMSFAGLLLGLAYAIAFRR
jgi:hypothetical protein